MILPIRDLFILDFEEAKKKDQHVQQELLSSCCSLYSGYIVQQQVNAAQDQEHINQHGTRDDVAIAELVDGNAKYQCNRIVVESMQVGNLTINIKIGSISQENAQLQKELNGTNKQMSGAKRVIVLLCKYRLYRVGVLRNTHIELRVGMLRNTHSMRWACYVTPIWSLPHPSSYRESVVLHCSAGDGAGNGETIDEIRSLQFEVVFRDRV